MLSVMRSSYSVAPEGTVAVAICEPPLDETKVVSGLVYNRLACSTDHSCPK